MIMFSFDVGINNIQAVSGCRSGGGEEFLGLVLAILCLLCQGVR